jgi:hypothetical protein
MKPTSGIRTRRRPIKGSTRPSVRAANGTANVSPTTVWRISPAQEAGSADADPANRKTISPRATDATPITTTSAARNSSREVP